MSFNITNSGDEAKTFRLFGGSTGLDTVDDNEELTPGEIVLSATSADTINTQSVSDFSNFKGCLNPLTGVVYYPITDNGSVKAINPDGSTLANFAFGSPSTTPSPTVPIFCTSNNIIYLGVTIASVSYIKGIDADPDSPTYNTVVKSVIVGNEPTALMHDAISNLIFISYASQTYIGIFSVPLNSQVGQVNALGMFFQDANDVFLIDNSKRKLWAANVNSDRVYVIDIDQDSATYLQLIQTISSNIDGANYPIINSSLGKVYLINQEDLNIVSIDTTTYTVTPITIGVGSNNFRFCISGNTIYISDFSNNRVRILDCVTGAITGDISTNTGPLQPVTDTVNRLVILTTNNTSNQTATVQFIGIDSNTIVKSITLPSGSNEFYTSTPVIDDENEIIWVVGGQYRANVISADEYLIVPVTVVVNGGASTMEEINNDTLTNPICICDINIVGSDKSVFNSPLRKNFTSATGTIDNTLVSLLAKFTAMQKEGINVVKLSSEDFNTCVLDGNNYLQWVVPAGENISIDVKYCQERPLDLLFREPIRQVVKVKKYIHGRFKYLLN